ncbi:hypothetical protein [Brevibacillus brevis]|uniref:hypothetical protein n=1 Tax=Brevibacillus brevis TaxID=1393 RepID=UPI001158EFF1|nr:hypothetical protein [Lysinibacillus sp. SDF0063]TQR29427.1 hypothetical protein C7Y45_28950 [Lysinibacillus sp. SDF0063]
MREKLFQTICDYSNELSRINDTLAQIGIAIPDYLLMKEAKESMSEEEMVVYLIEQSMLADQFDEKIREANIKGIEIFEIMGNHSPDELLGEVYNRNRVYDWLDEVKNGRESLEDFMEYLHSNHEEKAPTIEVTF